MQSKYGVPALRSPKPFVTWLASFLIDITNHCDYTSFPTALPWRVLFFTAILLAIKRAEELHQVVWHFWSESRLDVKGRVCASYQFIFCNCLFGLRRRFRAWHGHRTRMLGCVAFVQSECNFMQQRDSEEPPKIYKRSSSIAWQAYKNQRNVLCKWCRRPLVPAATSYPGIISTQYGERLLMTATVIRPETKEEHRQTQTLLQPAAQGTSRGIFFELSMMNEWNL